MKLICQLISIAVFGVLGALVSLLFTVAVFDLPRDQVILGAMVGGTLGVMAGIWFEKREPYYIWALILDGVFSTL